MPVAADMGRDQPFRRRQRRLLLSHPRRGTNLGRQGVRRRRSTCSDDAAPERLHLPLPHFRRGINLIRQRVAHRGRNRSGRVPPERRRPLLARFPPLQCVAHLDSETVVRPRGCPRPGVLPLLCRQLLARRPGERGGLDLAARHLPGEFACVAGGLPRDKHLRTVTLPRQRDIARRPAPMMGVIEVGVVEGLALALVDRPGIAVPEARELRCRPRHLAALPGGRCV